MKLDVKTTSETPPWKWHDGTEEVLTSAIRDRQSAATDRVLATELAGNLP